MHPSRVSKISTARLYLLIEKNVKSWMLQTICLYTLSHNDVAC